LIVEPKDYRADWLLKLQQADVFDGQIIEKVLGILSSCRHC
jgi:hypothetical protein